MRHYIQLLFLVIAAQLSAQQVSITRIDQMPDFPQPFEMRDWSKVASSYDSLVYNETLTGDYLPLVEMFTQTVNYPAHPSFGLHSYVGTSAPLSGEAINVLPSLIGATLCGIDKSNQFGKNWVLLSEEYFNKASGEDVYLNNPEGSSGSDWWYETMPNIFFYQLNDLYPHTGDFDYQFIRIADRWLEAVEAMGGNTTPWESPEMGYRAWNLSQMEPLSGGVPEPEAAGALAWILYSAYHKTGNITYRIGAEWCMEYLNELDSNPSYELQLPYGVYTAARMNAELGTSYDVDKMVNWCFDIGPLREWGAVVGNWGGLDCSGLIGEQSSGGVDYVFIMNGFQQAAALLPMVRYDDRYARTLGKWILNLANASRLFYSKYLPDENQDGETWSSVYDPGSVIAYEAMKETKGGYSPFATGDAVGGGWAQTNFALYGSSHVGMLGGIIKTTAVEGILQTDLLKTDYYRDDAYATFLYYNPYANTRQVIVPLGSESFDIYDCTYNNIRSSNVSGDYLLSIDAKDAVVIVLVPTGLEFTDSLKHTLAGNVVIDYFNGNSVDNFPPRIKSLRCKDSLVVIDSEHLVYCSAEDRESGQLQYSWTGPEGPWTNDSIFLWQAPGSKGKYSIVCRVKDESDAIDSAEIKIQVVDRILSPPLINSFRADTRKIHPGTSTLIRCVATDINGDTLRYLWNATGGTFSGDGSIVEWTSPDTEGDYTIDCQVSNMDSLHANASVRMMVRDSTYSQSGTIIANFKLNGSAFDFSSHHNHGSPQNVIWTEDHFGIAGNAADFNGENSVIKVTNEEYMNFADGLSITAWIKPTQSTSGEQFVISHGSWQHRWKVSLSNSIMRFTINGSSGIADLDAEVKLQTGSWQHFAAVYNGKDMEIYLDSRLEGFKPWTGTINSSSSDLTIGQMLPGETAYNYAGSIDDLRIFDYGLDQQTVGKIFSGELSPVANKKAIDPLILYPNPADNFLNIYLNPGDENPSEIRILNARGELTWASLYPETLIQGHRIQISIAQFRPGIYIICLLNKGEIRTQKLIIQ